MSPRPTVAVVILNFNGSEDTLECLRDLLRCGRPGCRVIVIDNGSTDSSISRILGWATSQRISFCHMAYSHTAARPGEPLPKAGERPLLTLLEAGANLGFAAGSNVGIQYALNLEADYVLLLNNDTVVPAGMLSELVRTAQTENAGIVGCRICRFDEPDRVWFLGGRFGWWNDCARTLPRSASEKTSQAYGTDWVTGCCMLVHRSVFEAIGFLDANAFLYREDVDFCRRAAAAGIRRVVTTRTTLQHKVSRSAGLDTPFTWYHYTKSRLYFHRKHHSAPSHLALLILFLPSRLARSLAWLTTGRPGLVRATWRAVIDAYRAEGPKSKGLRPAADPIHAAAKGASPGSTNR